MRIPQFSLTTFLVAVGLAALMIWVNIQERIVVSHSPAAFGLTDCVSIQVYSGWPLPYRWTSFLVWASKADWFVQKYPQSAVGAETPRILYDCVAINVVVACVLLGAVGCGTEWLFRRFVTSPKTGQLLRD